MQKFDGFPHGPFSSTQIPVPFFSQLLPLIDDLAELKVMLFCFWALPQKQGQFVYLRLQDFLKNEALMQGMAVIESGRSGEAMLQRGIKKAVERNALLVADVNVSGTMETLYFVNTEKGRLAIEQINAGQWQPGDLENPVEILPDRPNIYRIYEENIGPLSPITTDELKDMQNDYSLIWIEESIHIAVKENKRSLRYIAAILKRWKKEGKDSGEFTGKLPKKDGKRYVTGKYADFIDN